MTAYNQGEISSEVMRWAKKILKRVWHEFRRESSDMSKSAVYSPSRIALQSDSSLPMVLASQADDYKEAVDSLNKDYDSQNK